MVTQEETIQYTKEWIQKVETDITDLRNQLVSDLLTVWNPTDETVFIDDLRIHFDNSLEIQQFHPDGAFTTYDHRDGDIDRLEFDDLIILWEEFYLPTASK